MENEEKYTPAQVQDAQRLAKAIASIQDDCKRAAFIRIMEATLFGAEVAERNIAIEAK